MQVYKISNEVKRKRGNVRLINMVEDILDKKAVKEAEIHNNKHKKTYTHEEMMGMFGLSIDA